MSAEDLSVSEIEANDAFFVIEKVTEYQNSNNLNAIPELWVKEERDGIG